MDGFVVQLTDRPGEGAKVAEALAGAGVNAFLFGLASGDVGMIGFIASDEGSADNALKQAGVDHRKVPVLHVRLPDRPGEAARLTRRLADAGVNIQFWLPVERRGSDSVVAVGTSQVEAARRALGEEIVDWTYS